MIPAGRAEFMLAALAFARSHFLPARGELRDTRFLLLRLMLSGMICGIVLAPHGPVIGVSPLPD